MNNNLTLHVAGETSELVKIFLVSSMNYCTEILVNDQNTYIHTYMLVQQISKLEVFLRVSRVLSV